MCGACDDTGKCVTGTLPDGSTGGMCQCAAGFTGTDCSVHECLQSPSNNGSETANEFCSGHGRCQAAPTSNTNRPKSPSQVVLLAPAAPMPSSNGDTRKESASATASLGRMGTVISGDNAVLRGAAQSAARAYVGLTGSHVAKVTVTAVATDESGSSSSPQQSHTATAIVSPSSNPFSARNGTCYCDAGFGGPACSIRLCESNCNGHGVCASNGVCRCMLGYVRAAV